VPRPEQLVPPSPEICAVCGRDLGPGPWWLLEIGVAAHEACAPWERRPFPLRDLLGRLRALRGRLRLAAFAVDATIAMLERAERRWPRDARAILERGRAWHARLEQRMRELGLDRRG
jgi:hypothetical protein